MDFPQHQPVCRSAHSGFAPVAGGEHGFELLSSELAASRLHHGPDDTAAHFIEKSVPFDDEREQGSTATDIASSESADGGFHFIIARRGEGFEIVLSDEQC